MVNDIVYFSVIFISFTELVVFMQINYYYYYYYLCILCILSSSSVMIWAMLPDAMRVVLRIFFVRI